jgi:hypothetical protein
MLKVFTCTLSCTHLASNTAASLLLGCFLVYGGMCLSLVTGAEYLAPQTDLQHLVIYLNRGWPLW